MLLFTVFLLQSNLSATQQHCLMQANGALLTITCEYEWFHSWTLSEDRSHHINTWYINCQQHMQRNHPYTANMDRRTHLCLLRDEYAPSCFILLRSILFSNRLTETVILFLLRFFSTPFQDELKTVLRYLVACPCNNFLPLYIWGVCSVEMQSTNR
jgi:hypothetical protein